MIFINIAFSVVIFYVILVGIIKFLPVLGINPGNRIKPIQRNEGVEVTKKSMVKVFGIALLLRIILYVISIVSIILINRSETISLEVFLKVWNRWDAERYVGIVEGGYGALMFDETEPYNLAFFPLYPWIVRLFATFIPDARIAALIVSTLFYCLAMSFMYALVASEYGKKVAKLSIIFISIAPFSFFLGGMMTESTFLFTTVLAWYLIKKRKWFAAAVVGALCSMSRIVGILIVIPYVLELVECYAESFRERRYKEWFKNCLKNGIWIFIIPLGLVVYLALNYYYTGDCFKFLEYQHINWSHEICYFGKGMQNIWNEVLSGDRSLINVLEMFGPQALSYTFSAILMLICCRRHRSAYTLYYAIYFIIVSSDIWQTSGSRFMLVILPLYIMLAERVKKNNLLTIGLISISSILYAIYSTMHLYGYYIY